MENQRISFIGVQLYWVSFFKTDKKRYQLVKLLILFSQGWSMRTITKEEHFSVRRKSMKVEANLSARLNYFRNHRHLFALGIKQKMGIHLYWVSFSKTDNHEFHTWESSCTGFHFPKRTNQDISWTLRNTCIAGLWMIISTPNRQPGVLSSPLFLLETS